MSSSATSTRGDLVGGAGKSRLALARRASPNRIAGPLGWTRRGGGVRGASGRDANMAGRSRRCRASAAATRANTRWSRSAATARSSPPGWPKRCRDAPRPDPAGGRRLLVSRAALRRDRVPVYARTRKLLLRTAAAEELQAIVDALEAESEGAAARRRVRRRERIEIRRGRQPALSGAVVRVARPARRRPARPALRWPLSKRRSAPSTSEPTAIAPGSMSRSKWSVSKLSEGVCRETPRRRLRPALLRDIAIADPCRSAYFGPKTGWLDAAERNRSDLRTARPARV